MRAAWTDAYGPPEVMEVREQPDPHPGPGEVVLAVEYAGINFGETQLRSGLRRLGHREPPFVLGNEVSGRVVRCGLGTDDVLLGTRAVARMGGFGGYADLVSVDVRSLIPVPDGLELETAVALIAQGRTALQLLEEACIDDGDQILVQSAAGGTGTLLVQLARRAGAGRVVGTVGSNDKLSVVMDLGGADAAINYNEPTWAQQALDATGGDGFDVIFEAVGGAIGRAAFDVLAPGSGRYLAYGFSSGESTTLTMQDILMKGVAVIGVGGARAPSPADLDRLVREALDLAAAGELRPLIGAVYDLHDVVEAHRVLEDRATVGKVLLKM